MSKSIDLDFRPKTYFSPLRLESWLLAKVKSAAMRRQLKYLLAEGYHEDARHLMEEVAFSASEQRALEAFHPAFMGGNYLPDTGFGEVEIARINLQSTTSDVTCVYARKEEGKIHYRVVDEYGGETLQGPVDATTDLPMTLGELHDFFMKAWPLIELLEMNFEGDLDRALAFYSVDSAFYPALGQLIDQRVEAFHAENYGDREEEDDDADADDDR
jgi:hypothetical protein